MAKVTAASKRRQSRIVCFLLVACALSLNPTVNGQAVSSESPNPFGPEIAKKYPELLPEAGRLFDRLQRNITFPPDRVESRLLPLLPASTIAYFALPNYGSVTRQAWTIFQQELNDSPDLRAWWTDSGMAKLSPKMEESIDRFSSVSEYLGDEIVISAVLDQHEPNLLIVAEARQPGLKGVLQKAVLAAASKTGPGVRILDPQQLATATESNPQQLVVLVRPDFVIASNRVERLRDFSLHLDHSDRDFSSTPFAQRILQSYVGGISWVGALDLRKIVSQAPKDAGFATLRQIGFADVKYAVWEHRQANGHSMSQAEISFVGPRQGIASWLAAPQPMGSLEFVSPKPMVSLSLALKNPALIFDDIRQLSASNSKALASIAQLEQSLGITLQDDVLAQLSGEITLDIESVTPQPTWKAIFGVKDADRLQQTLGTMLTHVHMPTNRYSDNAGLVYHTLAVPGARETNAVAYAFVDRYLVIASGPEVLSDAVRLHKTGESLARSQRLLESLPGGNTVVSALFYEEPTAMMALQMQRLPRSQAQAITQLLGKSSTPVVMCIYGEPDAIREASANPGMDAGVVMMAAAIAIPNVLRARISANEASAVGNLRTVNVAQLSYAATYSHGYARDLASLGFDPSDPKGMSAAHAGYLDNSFAGKSCTGTQWCESKGYRFLVTANCSAGRCRDYVATATPTSGSTGTRSFCSTSDRLIRYQLAPPLSSPPTLRDCKEWTPLQ